MVEVWEPQVELVYEAGDYMGESPIWSADEQALYWTNVEREPRIRRFAPATGEVTTWPAPERVGGMALKEGGGAIVALASGVFDLDFTTGAFTRRAQNAMAPTFVLHEAKCDRQGRFWAGAFDSRFKLADGPSGQGWFQRLDGAAMTPVIPGVTVANGLTWSLDSTRLYHADSATDRVMVYDYDAQTGAATNGRLFAQLAKEDGVPDGGVTDAEGGYWLNFYRGGRIRRYLADGRVDREIKLPFTQGTMIAFGGPDLRTAYMTTTRHGFDAERLAREPLIGSVFRFDAGVAGVPETKFKDRA